MVVSDRLKIALLHDIVRESEHDVNEDIVPELFVIYELLREYDKQLVILEQENLH